MRSRPKNKVYMMLRLRGDDLSPEEVSRDLRLTPTHAFAKGEAFLAGKRWHRRASGMWMISTEDAVRSQELMDHCRCLLDWISPVRTQLKRYNSRPGIHTTVGFWWEPSDGPVGFTFPSKEIQLLAKMCADFDFYFA